MRTNKLRAALAAGRPLVGVMHYSPTVRWVEMVGHAGFDFIHFDAEHDGLTVTEAYALAIAADGVGLPSIIRVPANRPELLLAYAETGVDAVLAPHVRTAEDARALVAGLAFPPEGARGAGLGRSAHSGIGVAAREYYTSAESRTMAAALLEDREAYENLDEIIAVPGVELFMLGLDDLALSLGLPGQHDHPEVQRLASRARERLHRAGRPYGVGIADGDQGREEFARGASLALVGSARLLSLAAQPLLDRARSARGEDPHTDSLNDEETP